MTQLKIENHNSVALLNRLRIATRSTTSRERRAIFNGLKDALKGLGMIEAKGPIEGIYEGIDANGNHWFMVDSGRKPAEQSEAVQARSQSEPNGLDNDEGFQRALEELRLYLGGEDWKPLPKQILNYALSALHSGALAKEELSRIKDPDTTGK